ncbi:MAG: LytTR family transcriptional regulator [Prevotella sp.]|nr:LytTR family transcriptional regulator [Prevotella sp.]
MKKTENKLIYFNSRDRLIRIEVDKILYFEADGNYTNVVTANQLKACLTKNLSHMEQALATQLGKHSRIFMRIGKRFIVNMHYIYQIDILKQQLVLSDHENFTVILSISKDALKRVKELIIQIRR